MTPGGDQPADGAPIWMKYLGKGAGVVGGGGAIFFGIWCCLTLSPLCLVAGIWQIVAGFLVIVLEAPFCCFFLDFVQQFAGMLENRPVWQKALLYLIISLPSILMCAGLTTILGSGLIFAVAVLYGMIALGKKADRDQMRENALRDEQLARDKSNLVGNIHGQDVEAAKVPL